ncbi:hypothetical protein TNCV_599971 [Trichonephila clavipes]|nr:hypothetical protein TNCV_599971 [Trichonephila clavipes]
MDIKSGDLWDVEALVPPKIHHVQELMLVKSAEAQSPPVDVMWKFGEWMPARVWSSLLDLGSKLRGISI